MSADHRQQKPPPTRLPGPRASAEHGPPPAGGPREEPVTQGGGEVAEEAPGPGTEAALESVRRERDEYLDMVRRVQADFENYKKRMVRQQTDLLERAAESMVVKLLPVLDAFELARLHLGAEESTEAKALLAAAGLLSDTLAKEGLERFGDDGEVFDPATHEAVEHEPAADQAPTAQSSPAEQAGVAPHEPVVSAVLRPGYRYKGRVVRPAMVKVRG